MKYVVQPGDTLSEIGARYGVNVYEMWWANRDQISDIDLIHPGQVINIPIS